MPQPATNCVTVGLAKNFATYTGCNHQLTAAATMNGDSVSNVWTRGIPLRRGGEWGQEQGGAPGSCNPGRGSPEFRRRCQSHVPVRVVTGSGEGGRVQALLRLGTKIEECPLLPLVFRLTKASVCSFHSLSSVPPVSFADGHHSIAPHRARTYVCSM